MKNNTAFRFTYFTHKYDETCAFYTNKLGLNRAFSWDRNEHDQGSLFNAGVGLIEVLHLPRDKEKFISGLDYRPPQGAFMAIEVYDIDERFEKYKELDVRFKQEIVDQAWGHRSFSVADPNGIVLFFFEDKNQI